MATTVVLSLIQSREIEITVPQGVAFTFGLAFKQVVRDENGVIVKVKNLPTYEPMDISGMTFLNQIRTNFYDENGVLKLELTTDNVGGNYAVVNTETSRIDFFISATFARTLKKDNPLYFESKMLLAGEPVRRVQAKLIPSQDIARPVVIP
jgi:hypothetical protein